MRRSLQKAGLEDQLARRLLDSLRPSLLALPPLSASSCLQPVPIV